MKDKTEAQSLSKSGLNYSTNSSYFSKNELKNSLIIDEKSTHNITSRKKLSFGLVTVDIIEGYSKEQIMNEKPAEYLMPGNLIERGAITGIYAKKGTGKTFLNLAIIQYLLTHQPKLKILLFDADNPLKTLKARGIFHLKELYGERFCVSGNRIELKFGNGERKIIKPRELLALFRQAYEFLNEDLSDTVIILDTARKFINGDLNSDKVLDLEFFEPLEILRAQGATIIYYHHTTKGKGTDIDGDLVCKNSGSFADNGDNLLELTRIDENAGLATMVLKVTDYGKSREKFDPIAFTIPIAAEKMAQTIANKTQAFSIVDYVDYALNDGGENQEMKDALIECLKDGKTLKQIDLRKAMKARLNNIGATKIQYFIYENAGYLCDIVTGERNAKHYILKNTLS